MSECGSTENVGRRISFHISDDYTLEGDRRRWGCKYVRKLRDGSLLSRGERGSGYVVRRSRIDSSVGHDLLDMKRQDVGNRECIQSLLVDCDVGVQVIMGFQPTESFLNFLFANNQRSGLLFEPLWSGGL
jgi:hypothetical protein